MSSGLYSGVSGLALGSGLYRNVSGLWGGASGLINGFGGGGPFPGSSLYLDFLTPPLDSRITFSRGTNATLVDSTGKITYAPANLLLRSQEFDNASWSKIAATVTPNAAVSPIGTADADKLVEDTATSQHRIDQTPTSPAGAQTFSVFAKAAERAFMALRIGLLGCGFNLSDGTTYALSAGVTAIIVSAGDGWYRCSISISSAAANDICRINLSQTAGTLSPSYTGDGTSGIFVWGAQLEPVTYQTTPGPYVATTASAYYGPRFDYDPVTLAPRGLLIEEARTNLLTYSDQFNDAAWSKTAASITANATSSPDGTTNADKLVATAVTSGHFVSQAVTITASTNYTVSVYVKAAEYGWAIIYVGTVGVGQYVNLSTGAVGSTFIGAPTSTTVTNAGNGWRRVSMVFNSGVNTSVDVRVYATTADGTSSYLGDGTSGIYVYGAQLEAGSFATSYIPTVASTVSRSADVATMTGTNFSSWYNQSEGTIVAETALIAKSGASYGIYAVDDGTTNNAYPSFYGTGLQANSRVAGANIFTSNGTLSPISKSAFAYKSADYASSFNGATPTIQLSGAIPSGLNRLQLGAYNTLLLNGHLRAIAYYNTRLPNTQLQTLTAPSLASPLALDFISPTYTVGY